MSELIVPGILIAICTVSDIMTRTLPVWLIGLGGVVAASVSYALGALSIVQILFGVMLGGVIFLFAFFSKQSVGYGDALLFMAIGAGIGVFREVFLMWTSFLAAGLFGVILMIIRHKSKDYELPFVPFLSAAYALMVCMEGLA